MSTRVPVWCVTLVSLFLFPTRLLFYNILYPQICLGGTECSAQHEDSPRGRWLKVVSFNCILYDASTRNWDLFCNFCLLWTVSSFNIYYCSRSVHQQYRNHFIYLFFLLVVMLLLLLSLRQLVVSHTSDHWEMLLLNWTWFFLYKWDLWNLQVPKRDVLCSGNLWKLW